MTLLQLLEKTTLQDVFEPCKQVVAFDHNTSVGAVLEALSGHRLLSGPVVVRSPGDEANGAHSGVHTRLTAAKSVLGFVGVSDIMEALVQAVGPHPATSLAANQVEAVAAQLCDAPVHTLLTSSLAPPSGAPPVTEDLGHDWGLKGHLKVPLLQVISGGFLHAQLPLGPTMQSVRRNRVVHRLAVFDCTEGAEGGYPRVLGIFSQSDVIRFLHHHLDHLGPLGHRTLQDLGMATSMVVAGRRTATPQGTTSPGRVLGRRLVCVPQDMKTLEAFQVMYSEHVSGVGVLAEDGRLIGNCSASDLRCLAPGLFYALLYPLREFLLKRPLLLQVQQESVQLFDDGQSSGEGPMDTGDDEGGDMQDDIANPVYKGVPMVVTCQDTSTFADVIHLVCQRRVHRVYVVDPDQRPKGVVTLTDILQIVAAECEAAKMAHRGDLN